MEEFEYEELVKATESFSPSRLIGKGSHGCVYRGVLRDHRVIAVKTPSLGLRALRDNSKLRNETRVLSSLAEPHNSSSSSSSSSSSADHVIKLLGTSQDPSQNKLLVMEFMPNGSLHDLLHPPPSNDAPPPTWPARLRIALQVARALQSLHERKPFIVHRDIKSTNVLFDSDWNAKLADFGLAVVDGDDRLYTPAGTIGYLDPNYTCPSKLSRKNDVFSLGVVLLEIMSGRKAMDVSKQTASIVDWAISLIEGQRVMDICDPRIPLPSVVPFTHMVHIAGRCVAADGGSRPSASEIVAEMERVLIHHRVRVPTWLSPWGSLVLLKRWRGKHARRWDTSALVKRGAQKGENQGDKLSGEGSVA
ncbi:serine/threonine-protein kinase-like protein At5g23170 [Rhodamnia argentea]|uniref:Serine/threonine-protein kinase-like protein At5g23170 n=1 Tax=Rhodamnia argentea TaxID=178133 RepID=A0A8B8PX17_9MYRT|nr:serine/threonine-protein kinase-like protein At5g23170 [Rhodamnia argentea]